MINNIFQAIPWTYRETDPKTKQTRLTGYCIDFIAKLAEVMNFDYEIVMPKTERFGKRNGNGKWDGAVGDLVRGVTITIQKKTTLLFNHCRKKLYKLLLLLKLLTMV